MAGHSKWANIRHKKAAQDKKRGKIFAKLFREIMVAARMGGGNPETNPRLRAAIDMARSHNMPSENIERAIRKGTGEPGGSGEHMHEIMYEGYGPGGVAILVEAMTDNRNRTSSELRHLFSKHGGNLGEAGCVAWIFHRKGFIQVNKEDVDEETIFEAAIDAGAEDIQDEGDVWAIYTAPEDFFHVKESLESQNIPISTSEIAMIPSTVIHPTPEQAEKVLKLVEILEDHDDVQKVWVNMELSDEILEKVAVDA